MNNKLQYRVLESELESTLKTMSNFIFFPLVLAMPYGMWDLSFPTSNQTHTPCSGSTASVWTTREVPFIFFNEKKNKHKSILRLTSVEIRECSNDHRGHRIIGRATEPHGYDHKLWHQGIPHGSVVKNLPANAGDIGLIPDQGRSHRLQSN